MLSIINNSRSYQYCNKLFIHNLTEYKIIINNDYLSTKLRDKIDIN
jgi:hypothetical protein